MSAPQTFLRRNLAGGLLLIGMWLVVRPVLMVVQLPYTHNILVWLKKPDGCKIFTSQYASRLLAAARYKSGDKSLVLFTKEDLPSYPRESETVKVLWEEFNLITGQSRDVYPQWGGPENELIDFSSMLLPGPCQGINYQRSFFENNPVFTGPHWSIFTLNGPQDSVVIRMLTLGRDFVGASCDDGNIAAFEGSRPNRLLVCPIR